MTPKSILVPIDFGTLSEHALDYACGLARKLGAKIDLVNAIGATIPELSASLSDSLIESLRVGNRTLLEKLVKDRVGLALFDHLIVEPGDPRTAILKVAEKLRPDLIIIGSHGRHGLTRLVLGSVAEYVVRHAVPPVLVYHLPPPN